MAYPRGTVVWSRDPFRPDDNPRPWLVLSTDDHPFYGEEYCCVLLTTTARDRAVPVREADWVDGGSPGRSYVSPWVPMTVKDDHVRNRQGRLADSLVERIADALAQYIGTSGVAD